MPDGLILSIDIGGTNLRTGIVDLDGGLHGFELTPSLPVLDVPDPGLSLARHIEDYLARNGSRDALAAIAVGLPGTIDLARRVVVSAANIASLQDVPLADCLERHLRVPTVIDRDVNMLMRYDLRALKLTEDVVIGCYVGTGFGNAISFDGRIFVGSHGVAGELGHVPYPKSRRRCGCGNTGCVEAVASGRSLVEMAERRFPRTPFADLFVTHQGHPLIEEFVANLAVPIAAEINIIDPAVVILGGGVIRMAGFPLRQLEKEIRLMIRKPLPWEAVRFVSSVGGQDAGVIGGAIYAWSQLARMVSGGAVGLEGSLACELL